MLCKLDHILEIQKGVKIKIFLTTEEENFTTKM